MFVLCLRARLLDTLSLTTNCLYMRLFVTALDVAPLTTQGLQNLPTVELSAQSMFLQQSLLSTGNASHQASSSNSTLTAPSVRLAWMALVLPGHGQLQGLATASLQHLLATAKMQGRRQHGQQQKQQCSKDHAMTQCQNKM